ncbi:esterase/lipase family protein [Gimesia aquarii]|uniref:AB hydrolase-1 domain-containing protein n=1 Tax=Gimesia aquarii TaxID=2527964 RepID=A0A517VS22_9PLAN|nr:alpha/beta fold hydrolase [Gimesia aquarii]QDT95811.1 hypothetical protein V144x_12580 [Gimesia aquarii]
MTDTNHREHNKEEVNHGPPKKMGHSILLNFLFSLILILASFGYALWQTRIIDGNFHFNAVRWEFVLPFSAILATLPWFILWIRRKKQTSLQYQNDLQNSNPSDNNKWYTYNNSDTVLVFIHGVLSDSRSCWLNQERDKHVFWPDLIGADSRFNDPAIFLAGYYTEINSGSTTIRDCAEQVFSALGRPDVNGHAPVLNWQRIVFVCHSMGGIVARYLLESNQKEFENKEIGLVLIASPSYGSKLANRLSPIIRFYGHSQGKQLKWGGELNKDLDFKFKKLIDKKSIPGLSGVEFYENHFIAPGILRFLKWKWIPLRTRHVVVTEESAGRYFGAPKLIPNSDHFTSVKPDNQKHCTHEYFYDFLKNKGLLPKDRADNIAAKHILNTVDKNKKASD